MKSIIATLITVLATIGLLSAQVPQGFSYQAVARDATGACLANQSISLQVTVRDSSPTGPIFYQENHFSVATNAQGLFSLQIGIDSTKATGAGAFTNMSKLDWGGHQYWMEIGMDGSGGGTFVKVGSQQLLSVPFALYAENKPYFDSGWFPMSSQDGNDSYKEVIHGLGRYPSEVKVLVRAINGNNMGFIFEGTGASQNDDDTPSKNYGGLIYAYNQQMIRLWAPTRNNTETLGRIISVWDGWGNSINNQASDDAEVRVLVWQ